MRFLQNTTIDFIGKRKYFYALSLGLVLMTIGSLIYHRGLNPSIDFSGGTLVQGSFAKPVEVREIRRVLSQGGFTGVDIQSIPLQNEVIIRLKSIEQARMQVGSQVTDLLVKGFSDNSFTSQRVEFVGPVVGRHLMAQASWSMILSLLGICLYVGFRFRKLVWGITGVIALIHDVFLTVGFMSIFGREMSITVMAALLTLAGYSINDTIVIFDRIRENLRNSRKKEDLAVLMNRSMNETLSRTIITSLTVFFVLLSLLFFGGEVLRDFSLAMTFGVLVGSYSTIFIASAMVHDWQKGRKTPLW